MGNAKKNKELILTGENLTIDSLYEASLSPHTEVKIEISDLAKEKMSRSRKYVHEVVKRGNDEIYLIGSQAISSRKALFEVLSKLPHEPGLIVKVNGTTSVAFALAAIQEGRNAGFDKVTYVPTNP